MSRPCDPGKERFWRRALQRQRRSGLSVRAYCVQHDLSEASFYAWRRTIAQRDREASGKQSQNGGRAQGASLFTPVRLLPTAADSLTPCVSAPLEVVLAHGRLLRVAPGFDPATLRQLLTVLEESAC